MGVSSKRSPSAMEKDLVPHPIMRAALEGNLRVLKEMATVVKNESGIWNRALMLAAMEGRLDVCRLLVEDVRVDVNQPITDDEGNHTAVCISAMLGTAATTRYLLDCGADPTVAGSMGTALHGAVLNGQYETIELLLSRGIDVDLFDSVHGTALHVAASKGEAGTVKLLLEHHADPNKVLNLDSTPLGLAIQNKSLECVRLLLKAGADPNFLYYNGVTYTMVAANNGLPDIMKCLLDAGANPNTPDGFGTTAIEIAALHGRRAMVEMLFPLTSPVSTVPDWSIDGILSHVNIFNLNPRFKNPLALEAKIAEVKSEATEAFRRKEYMRAAELYHYTLKLEDRVKEHAFLLANRSFCFLRMGKGEDAVSDATKCIECLPYWPKGYYRQGAAYMLLKDYGKACKAFEDGLKLDRTNVDIKNALREAQEALKSADCVEKKTYLE
ncbi:ankyrin repeat domain-containing protein 50-like [Lolium rigidum]|uniref:ankyrin repeat domain-containing protein 50-like n=1 Tax=Lolium rigidum TaxID=89674 RepID=UPI001F5D84B9|nr:ankyrin repeat domain-containing protein 50-like [Lolium rigidum]